MSKLAVILVIFMAFSMITSVPVMFEDVLPRGCQCSSAPDEVDPVCGNNGVTYANLGVLRCANDCVIYSIHPMHHGPCKT